MDLHRRRRAVVLSIAIAMAPLSGGCHTPNVERTDQSPKETSPIAAPAIIDARPIAAAPIMDAKSATSCVVAFGCFLSHPGLGSSGSSSSVNLATCERTTTSYNGPYDDGHSPPVPTKASSASTPKPNVTPLARDACAKIVEMIAAMTADDVRTAQESAQMDSTACTLTVMCPPNTTPSFAVQRQTTSGPSRVEQLIRAVL